MAQPVVCAWHTYLDSIPINCAWWCVSITVAFGERRQGDQEVQGHMTLGV